ncbi:MAG: hypothetical protein EOM24_15055 [Chloroflexia bacterium]|nr:hypothetical protein [Chloroflexia bacterium]
MRQEPTLGDEHPQFGLARNSWLSGTASWTYQAATKHILGICPTYTGLAIVPCIPPEWDGFAAQKWFRGAFYQINVKNPDHVSGGVRTMLVDGKPVTDGIAPLFQDGKTHNVEVVLGA